MFWATKLPTELVQLKRDYVDTVDFVISLLSVVKKQEKFLTSILTYLLSPLPVRVAWEHLKQRIVGDYGRKNYHEKF